MCTGVVLSMFRPEYYLDKFGIIPDSSTLGQALLGILP